MNKEFNQSFSTGDSVTYAPPHSNGDIKHPDCEQGIIKNVTDNGAFVNYYRNGIIQQTAQLTPYHLLFKNC